MSEIVNRVQESGLISMDLADFKPTLSIQAVDIAEQLWQGLVLKEKDFRSWIKENDWDKYADSAVYVHCSVDAIVPTWAFMLIGSQLESAGAKYIIGTEDDLQKQLIKERIQEEDLTHYVDGRIIIKGCADVSCPEYAMVELVRYLQPVAKSIMYGEPCSTVPVFKRK